ncbi:hypothetical protein [Actinomycetospora lutea]|uniref:PASTA domain-containing protein n=1 Tax=Actinomycetospora lutea TaxID=663604 RepID=UPI003B67AED2
MKRVGHGFRNFTNYRLRLLLHCETVVSGQSPEASEKVPIGTVVTLVVESAPLLYFHPAPPLRVAGTEQLIVSTTI